MRFPAVCLAYLACVVAGISPTLHAQTPRDSAGVLIIENDRPTWAVSERLRLAPEPHLVIGNRADSAYIFRSVAAVLQLTDDRVAVVDRGSVELRLFSANGDILSRTPAMEIESGQDFNALWVQRLDGDTIAIETSRSTMSLFTNTGEFVRTVALPPWADTSAFAAFDRPRLVGLLNSGQGVVATEIPGNRAPRPDGSQRTDSMRLELVTPESDVRQELGIFPWMRMVQGSSGRRPVWLAPYGFYAGKDDRFYVGFGDKFEVQIYDADGKLQSIIRRAWTPTPITDADWEHWVVEWSKLWIRSTGAQRELEIQSMRDAAWAEQNPAFSLFVVDEIGRLWVRDAHWQDAIAAGSLADRPSVPSTWSVFDRGGRWLGEVGMPVGFQVSDIGADYVTGTRRVDGLTEVVVYELIAGGQ